MKFIKFNLSTATLWSILSLSFGFYFISKIHFTTQKLLKLKNKLHSLPSKIHPIQKPFHHPINSKSSDKMNMEWKICIFMWLNHSKSEKCVVQYNSKSTQKKAQNCFCFFIDIILHNSTKVMCAFFIIIIQQMSIDGQWNVEEKKSLQLATLFVKCTHYLFVYDTESDVHAHYCLWWFTRQSH